MTVECRRQRCSRQAEKWTKKRLRWVGHALRRDDSDLSKTEVKSELALSSKQRTKCVLSDMQSLEIQTIKDLETKLIEET